MTDAIRWAALDRAINGVWVPVMRRGTLVRTEFRHNDRLAIALLGGRNGATVTEQREQAASRRRYRQFLADHAAAQAAAKREAEEAAAAYQAELDAMLEKGRQGRASASCDWRALKSRKNALVPVTLGTLANLAGGVVGASAAPR